MKIVQVSAEITPWSKTGGLGDVSGALPLALAARGHRIVTVAPRYREYADAWDTGVRAQIHLFGHTHEVRYFHGESGGVHHLFIDHPSYRRAGIYGDSNGPFGDNLFRYALLCRAGIEAAIRVPIDGECFGDDVVFHANDWHAGLLPLYLQAMYRPAGRFGPSGSLIAVHNAGHQGSHDAHAFPGLDVSARWWPQLDFGGRINPLKAGLVTAGKVVAVSPTYAREVQTELGFGLESIFSLRDADLHGILNGVDAAWNPADDVHLPAHFTADDLTGKAVCKAALQRELGLPQRPDVPLLAVIARLDHQKGIDLIIAAAPWLLRHDVQLVIVGSGGRVYEDFVRSLAREWPDKARGWVGFNEPLAHRVEAGADLFLMPSRFEPCGLNQMYSMRYGTVPIVHATGGLADTVETVDPGRDVGTGWAFRSFTAEAFMEAIGWALLTYRAYPDAWRAIQHRGMTRDWSWDRAAAQYETLYESTIRG